MAKLIIDAQTGTVLGVEHCFVVDTDDLGADDADLLENASDSELGELAQRVGKSIVQIGQDTGWGDNKYRWSVSYSPKSITDEADCYLEGGIYTEADSEYKALLWARDNATTEELAEISDTIMNYDNTWEGFRENLLESLVEYYNNREAN